MTTKKNILRLLSLLAVAGVAGALIVHYWPAAGQTARHAQMGGMGRGKRGGPMLPGGSVPVQTTTVGIADVPQYVTALGTVVPNASVTVTSQVDGQLMKVFFSEGQLVKKGQLLAQLDARSYQATLAQYEGELAQNQALLKSAKLTLTRYKELYAKDSLAKQDLDSQIATVGQYQGAVKADQAQIAAAKLNIDYAAITAPVSGRVGLRLVDPGNVVHSSDTTGLVTITQIQPIAVTFSVPQSYVQTLLKALHQGTTLPVTALDQDGATELASGSLNFISNEIDSSTGTVKLKAMFANSDEALYPNQFVNARLQIGQYRQVPVVSSQAIQLSSDGSFVYVVGADNTVTRTAVKTGPQLGADQQAILEGLKGGEQVVTAGIDNLNTGSKVSVVTASSGSKGQQ
jgi:multidrug efflux system membrane fusion protein